MQVTSILDQLSKIPESHTADTLSVLKQAREQLVINLVKNRQPNETVRKQGQVELIDEIILKLTKE